MPKKDLCAYPRRWQRSPLLRQQHPCAVSGQIATPPIPLVRKPASATLASGFTAISQ